MAILMLREVFYLFLYAKCFFFQGIEKLEVVMIGPSVPESEASIIINSCCEPCTRQGQKLNISIYTSKYEEFHATRNYTRPFQAIAFNCGFHDTSTGWVYAFVLYLVSRNSTSGFGKGDDPGVLHELL
jgi:hypothetical protein